jgi:hypothetical protein
LRWWHLSNISLRIWSSNPSASWVWLVSTWRRDLDIAKLLLTTRFFERRRCKLGKHSTCLFHWITCWSIKVRLWRAGHIFKWVLWLKLTSSLLLLLHLLLLNLIFYSLKTNTITALLLCNRAFFFIHLVLRWPNVISSITSIISTIKCISLWLVIYVNRILHSKHIISATWSLSSTSFIWSKRLVFFVFFIIIR